MSSLSSMVAQTERTLLVKRLRKNSALTLLLFLLVGLSTGWLLDRSETLK